VTQYKVRTLSRKVKLFRDNLVDNSIVMDASHEAFLGIIKIIFENTFEPDPEDDAEQPSEDDEDTPGPSDVDPEGYSAPGDEASEMFENSANRSQLTHEYRRLYREIIKRAHPDRHKILGVDGDYETSRLEKIFSSAKTHSESGSEQGIIEICAQLEVDLVHLDKEFTIECLGKSQATLAQIIEQQEKSLGWVWHMIEDDIDSRVKLVRAFINGTLYEDRKVSDTLIKDAILCYNKDGSRKKRKTGERPPKLLR
jgi:hypothetical protein